MFSFSKNSSKFEKQAYNQKMKVKKTDTFLVILTLCHVRNYICMI